ncbi:MAG: hypothetical protein UV51_C0007G0027 [Candidatus Woesebacteria bacterium GW2011_GWC1_42_9]|nr:MAG: hypothetical protein UV51_C0007G0027 [Candidatus Woesebacteria bacterium GW2011_GWC1_42_9]
MEEEVQKTVEAIHNGTLADTLKQNMKYTITGIAVGIVAGILAATVLGKCRLCFGFWGAVGGGSIGYIISTKNKFHNCCI